MRRAKRTPPVLVRPTGPLSRSEREALELLRRRELARKGGPRLPPGALWRCEVPELGQMHPGGRVVGCQTTERPRRPLAVLGKGVSGGKVRRDLRRMAVLRGGGPTAHVSIGPQAVTVSVPGPDYGRGDLTAAKAARDAAVKAATAAWTAATRVTHSMPPAPYGATWREGAWVTSAVVHTHTRLTAEALGAAASAAVARLTQVGYPAVVDRTPLVRATRREEKGAAWFAPPEDGGSKAHRAKTKRSPWARQPAPQTLRERLLDLGTSRTTLEILDKQRANLDEPRPDLDSEALTLNEWDDLAQRRPGDASVDARLRQALMILARRSQVRP